MTFERPFADALDARPVAAESAARAVASRALADAAAVLLRYDLFRLPDDAEEVHRARVAARRLRSTLRTFAVLFDEAWATALRDELAWFGSALGAVRDADVALERIDVSAARLPASDRAALEAVVHPFAAARRVARLELAAALRDARYAQLRALLADAEVRPKWTAVAAVPDGALAAFVMREPWRALRKAVAAADDAPSDAALHRIRIRAKRCRYAAEAVADVEGKRALRFAARAAALQETLGALRDAAAAHARLAAIAGTSAGAAAFVAGELAGFELVAATAARARWRRDLRALQTRRARFWRR
jgi:CHAD domain-containing protein